MASENPDSEITAITEKYQEQFTTAEMQIVKIILVRKIKNGITARLRNINNNRYKNDAITSLLESFDELKTQESETVMATANLLGLSDKRYWELFNFVYEKEKSF